jgi:DNA-directed RNA polymerase specialized sigma24 family protein
LVDHARAKTRAKRGGSAKRVGLEGIDAALPASGVDLIALDEALDLLSREDARAAAVAEWLLFGGQSRADIARRMGLSLRTVDQDWAFARAKLKLAIAGPDRRGEPHAGR